MFTYTYINQHCYCYLVAMDVALQNGFILNRFMPLSCIFYSCLYIFTRAASHHLKVSVNAANILSLQCFNLTVTLTVIYNRSFFYLKRLFSDFSAYSVHHVKQTDLLIAVLLNFSTLHRYLITSQLCRLNQQFHYFYYIRPASTSCCFTFDKTS